MYGTIKADTIIYGNNQVLNVADILTKVSLNEYISNINANTQRINDLMNIIQTLSDNAVSKSDLQATLDTKANVADVYCKTDIDRFLSQKADISAIDAKFLLYDQKLEKVITDYDGKLNLKANCADVYNKADVDARLGIKADKTYVDTKFDIVNQNLSNLESKLQEEINKSASEEFVKNKIDLINQTLQNVANELNVEIARATKEDAELSAKINVNISKISEIKNSIQKINSDVDHNKDAISSILNRLTQIDIFNKDTDTRINNLDQKVQDNYTAIESIKVDYNNKVETINKQINKIENDYNRVKTNQDIIQDNYKKLNETINNYLAKLDNEIDRAQGREKDIEDKLDNEINRAISKDNELDNSIKVISEKIDSEINRSINKDNYLESKIDDEINRSQGREKDIEDKLDSEINRSISKDNELENILEIIKTDLRQEINRSIDKDNYLESKIDDEILRAQNKEVELQAEINSLDNKIEVLDSKMDQESDRAQSKENELEEKINSEKQRATEKENELDKRKAEKTDYRFNKIMVIFDGTNYDEEGWCSIIKGYGVKGVKRIREGRYRIYFKEEVKDGYIPMITGNGNNANCEADGKYTLKLNSELFEDGFKVANVATELQENSSENNSETEIKKYKDSKIVSVIVTGF